MYLPAEAFSLGKKIPGKRKKALGFKKEEVIFYIEGNPKDEGKLSFPAPSDSRVGEFDSPIQLL